jgi:hypothetical protein
MVRVGLVVEGGTVAVAGGAVRVTVGVPAGPGTAIFEIKPSLFPALAG